MKPLDPHFGSSTGKELMFELRLSVIKCETTAIARSTDIVWFKRWYNHNPSAGLARYDMKKSIQELRDAADRLETLLSMSNVPAAAE